MNNHSLTRFEQYLIQNKYAYNNIGFVSECLSKCQGISCQDRKSEFHNRLVSWITLNDQIENVVGILLEIRLFNYLISLNPEFVQTSSDETTDIEIKNPILEFEIECTHSLRKTMKQFDEKTTLRSDDSFNEKEAKIKADEAVGIVNSSYAHWTIRKALARKACKEIQKPFIIYFWYPKNGFSLDSVDFNDIINYPYQYEITSDRSKWDTVDYLLKSLERDVSLKNYKKASKDLEDLTRKQFYNLINQEKIIQEQKHHEVLMSIGGNVDLYRRNKLTDDKIKEYMTNSLIFTYIIQKSNTLVGLLIDHSKLDEKPKLQLIEKHGKNIEFEKIKQIFQGIR